MKHFFSGVYAKITGFIKARPLSAFFVVIAILLVIIVLGDILTKPKVEKTVTPGIKSVTTYNIGKVPHISFQAKIEKTGVVKITALTPGIVQKIFVKAGDSISRGTEILSLSSNYNGGNIPFLSAEIAKKQYQNTNDTFPQQQDLIQKQREIANASLDNFSDMQSIASDSAGKTNTLIDANQAVLDSLNNQLSQDKANGAGSTIILAEEEQINQLQAGQNQLREAAQNINLQTNSGKPAGRLASTQHDLTLEQLDLQAKLLELNKEIAKLQMNIAQVTASSMYPATPFSGTVQRVYVHPGQQVVPGTDLAEVSSTDQSATALVLVPKDIAENVSSLDESVLYTGQKTYSLRPLFISSEATDGQLFSILYPVPDAFSVRDGEYVTVDVPIGSVNTNGAIPLVPLDGVYQTQNSASVLVVQDKKAVSRSVSLGNVFGNYVQVVKGLHSGDQIILDRTIVAGEKVQIN